MHRNNVRWSSMMVFAHAHFYQQHGVLRAGCLCSPAVVKHHFKHSVHLPGKNAVLFYMRSLVEAIYVYVCAYLCMCIYWTIGLYVYTYMCMCVHICIYVHMYIHMPARIHMYMYLHIYIHTYACTYMHVSEWMCRCMCDYMTIYVHICPFAHA